MNEQQGTTAPVNSSRSLWDVFDNALATFATLKLNQTQLKLQNSQQQHEEQIADYDVLRNPESSQISFSTDQAKEYAVYGVLALGLIAALIVNR